MTFATWLLELAFPKVCCSCGQRGQYLCETCFDQLTFWSGPVPLPIELPECPPLLAATVFAPPLSNLIHTYKYQGVKAISHWGAALMHQALQFPKVDLVTCVPSHPTKFKHRGFNPSQLLAKELAHRLQLPYQDLVIKNRATAAQASLTDRAERLHSQDQVFSLTPNCLDLSQRHILLVDDVITTGGTVTAVAQVLRQAGAATITAACLAHGQ